MTDQDRPLPRVQLITKPGSAATGIGRYAAELARGLQAHGAAIHHAPLLPAPRPLARAAGALGYDLETFVRSYPLRAGTRQGITTHLTSQTLATLLLTQRLPRPVVVTVHDILPYLLRGDPALRVYHHRLDGAMDALAMRGLRRADVLIADSRYTKQTVIDALGVPAGRIEVVPLGIDSERFKPHPVPESFRERYGLPADGDYVLHVGSEDPRKDLPTLLRAFARARTSLPHLTLLKVGAPAFTRQRERHLALCQELDISAHVRWFDQIPEEDLVLFYNAASVFAFPSRYEGFGFPVLEAMACGTPVVAVNASSVAELLSDVAIPVAPGDDEALARAIVQVVDGHLPATPDAMVRHARTFRWDRTVASVIDIYRRLPAHHARATFARRDTRPATAGPSEDTPVHEAGI